MGLKLVWDCVKLSSVIHVYVASFYTERGDRELPTCKSFLDFGVHVSEWMEPNLQCISCIPWCRDDTEEFVRQVWHHLSQLLHCCQGLHCIP